MLVNLMQFIEIVGFFVAFEFAKVNQFVTNQIVFRSRLPP